MSPGNVSVGYNACRIVSGVGMKDKFSGKHGLFNAIIGLGYGGMQHIEQQ
jgi:hypothetical protein